MHAEPPSMRPISWTLATCSPFRRSTAQASRMNRSIAWCPTHGAFGDRIFTAYRSPVSRSCAATTVPMPPSPSTRSTRYLPRIMSPARMEASPRAALLPRVPRSALLTNTAFRRSEPIQVRRGKQAHRARRIRDGPAAGFRRAPSWPWSASTRASVALWSVVAAVHAVVQGLAVPFAARKQSALENVKFLLTATNLCALLSALLSRNLPSGWSTWCVAWTCRRKRPGRTASTSRPTRSGQKARRSPSIAPLSFRVGIGSIAWAMAHDRIPTKASSGSPARCWRRRPPDRSERTTTTSAAGRDPPRSKGSHRGPLDPPSAPCSRGAAQEDRPGRGCVLQASRAPGAPSTCLPCRG